MKIAGDGMVYTEKELHEMSILASKIMTEIHIEDRTGKLPYLFCKQLCAISRLKAYDISRDDKYKFVVITEDEYKKLKGN